MTAASSNITTHWTFRDGRDYLLSLTTTETPNTVSFWISDKITGEEWTGCYDENGIEVITKRTGCFKSFQTFLAMIKSAILKKSESVVLDLLNIEDLAAISLHRQNSVTEGGNIPLNLQLYSKTGEISSGSSLGTASTLLNRNGKAAATQKQSDIGSGISNINNNNKSSLNKRKYLIVTYIAEFDKVHYPLPLNYSNPPDLSVMQNNIISLKAEVTSLKNAKGDLETQLQSLKSGSLPNSHENINANRNLKTVNKIISDDESNKYMKPGEHNTHEEEGLDGSCMKCLDLINALQSKVRELENVISTERDENRKAVENIENANNFLRHKVEAAEKYELELWTQIKQLKEKVALASDLGKEKKRDERKDIIPRNRFHQSRHDLFYYNSKTSSVASRSPQKMLSASPVAPLKNYNNTRKPNTITNNKGKIATISSRNRSSSAQYNEKPTRSRSDSTGSYGSVEAVIKDSDYIQKRILEQLKDVKNNYRSRSSSYHSINFRRLNSSLQKSRYRNNYYSLSPSPSNARFDPTAYVVEKKRKLSKIADLRLQKIESRIRSGSRPSPSEKLDQITTLISPKREQSSNGRRRLKNESNQKSTCAEGLCDYNEAMQTYNFTPLKDRLEKKKTKKAKDSGDQLSRPTSALSSSGATRIITHSPLRIPPETRRNAAAYRSPPPSKIIADQLYKQKSNRFSTKFTSSSKPFSSELSQRLLKSPAKTTTENSRTSRKLPNDHLIIMPDDAITNASKKVQKSSGRHSKINDQKDCDIATLQNKLTALQAFLETCKQPQPPPPTTLEDI